LDKALEINPTLRSLSESCLDMDTYNKMWIEVSQALFNTTNNPLCFYFMQMYKLKWEFAFFGGKLIVSLRPPQSGLPPWAFVSLHSAPNDIDFSKVIKCTTLKIASFSDNKDVALNLVLGFNGTKTSLRGSYFHHGTSSMAISRRT
jgi:hypothetical protein